MTHQMQNKLHNLDEEFRSDTRALFSVADQVFGSWNDQSTQKFRDQMFAPLIESTSRFQRDLQELSEQIKAAKRRLSD